mgnify:CR=1 FL=1
MTIASQTSTASFAGNGVTVSFPLPFRFVSNADLLVVLRAADGSETRLAENTDYELSGAGAASGGACLLRAAPLAGQTLVLARSPRIVQETDYQENDAFPAESHEAALDLLTMICQALDERLGRAALLPVSCGLRGPVLAEPAPGRALLWDASGTALATGPSAADITQAQGHALAAQTARQGAEAARDAAQAAAASAETPPAASIAFDNAGSGLVAGDVQAALDELAADAADQAAVDQLRNLLLAEAMRRAVGDSVNGREFLGNGWLDPLADADEVAVTGGSFVAADSGYITNAGGADVVTAFDLTSAQFLDEKGSIAAFTCDTANTSGHFDAAAGARIKAGCRMVIGGTSFTIKSITGDGTAANSVVFSGALATGAHAVSGIYGAMYDAGIQLSGETFGYNELNDALSGGGTSTVYAGYTVIERGWKLNNGMTIERLGVYNSVAQTLVVSIFQQTATGHYTRVVGATLSHTGGSFQYVYLATPYAIPETGDYYCGVYIASGSHSVSAENAAIAKVSGNPSLGVDTTFTEQASQPSVRVNAVGYYGRPMLVHYPALVSLDCTDWTAVSAFARTSTLNSQGLFYALSFDGGTTYSAFVGSAWLQIVRNNAGTWEYWTGSAWTAATINSAFGAMAQAVAVAGNQMAGATLVGLTAEQIAGSGGFSPGQTILPVLLAFYSTSSAATPALSALSATADVDAHDMVAEFDAFEAQDPDQAKVVLVIEAVDDVTLDADLKAWARRGEGGYAQVPLVMDSPYDAARVLVAGDLDQGGSGTATRLKITSHNHRELRIYSAANCFRSA